MKKIIEILVSFLFSLGISYLIFIQNYIYDREQIFSLVQEWHILFYVLLFGMLIVGPLFMLLGSYLTEQEPKFREIMKYYLPVGIIMMIPLIDRIIISCLLGIFITSLIFRIILKLKPRNYCFILIS